MSKEFHTLKVSQLVKETDVSTSIFFEVPEHLSEDYTYKAGQYLTLKMTIDGQEVRRAYSICTSPLEASIAVNVKRVKRGLVSNYIHDQLKIGDSMDIMTPEGNFVYSPVINSKRDFYFFASGSGITPIISIIKTILEEEPKSICYLCYGNRDENNIIFKSQIEQLQKKYAGQFFVEHVLSNPLREKESGLKGLFSKGKATWTGWTGRVEAKRVDEFLEKYPKMSLEAHYYVCGPGAMIDTIIDHLSSSKGIKKDFLHTEHFVSKVDIPSSSAVRAVQSHLTFHLQGKAHEITLPSDKTILDTLVAAKFDPPYSCTSGACSTCIAKVINGQVAMDVCYALDDNEVKAGYILTCQSRALTPEVEISFEA